MKSVSRKALQLVASMALCAAGATARAEVPRCAVDYTINPLTDTPDFQQFYGMDMALRANGRPVIAFYGRATEDASQESLFVHHCLDRACSPGLTRKLFTSSFVSGRPRLFMQPNGHPVVVNNDWTAVNVFACQDEMCNGGSNHRITPATGTDMMDAAMRSDGRLVMVYFEQQQDKLNLVTCDDPECSTFVDHTIVDEFHTDAVIPALAIGPDERPIVAMTHYGLGGGDPITYEVLACDSAACEAPVRTTLAGEIAFWPMIAIRGNGLPLIHEAFNNQPPASGTRYQLRYCEDFACSTSLLRSPQSLFYDRTRSVTLGQDDVPILGMDGLRWGYIRCTDPECTGAERVELGLVPVPGSVGVVAASDAKAPSMALLNFNENKLYAAVCSDDDVFSNGDEPKLDLTPVDGD
jgi:hypothetical protein